MKNANRYDATKLPKADTPIRRGKVAYTARHGDLETRRAAKEALRRASAEKLDAAITGWRDDGTPIRDDDPPEAA